MDEIKIKSATFKSRKLVKFWDNHYRYERMDKDHVWLRYSSYSVDVSECSSNDIIEVLEAFKK